MRSRRSRIIAIALLSIAAAFSGCSPAKDLDPPVDSSLKPPIAFRITWAEYSGRGVAIQEIVDTYNNMSTASYEIVLQSGNEDIKEIEDLLKSDAAAPVLVLPYRYVKYLGQKGDLRPLTADFEKDKDLFYPELWNLGVVESEQYGIPWIGHSVCLIYNKDLLDAAMVNPDLIKSRESLVQALESVESRTDAKGIGLVGANHNDISWMVNQFIYGFGSQLVDETGTRVTVNNEKSKEAISFYKDVLGAHAQATWLTDTGVEVMDHFRNQEIAFEFQGVWGVADIAKNGKPFEVGVINLEDVGLYSEVGPMMLAIPNTMAREEAAEAVRFIAYMISAEAQGRIMNGEYSPEHDAYYPFRVPVRKDMAESLVFENYPEYLPFLKGFVRPSVDVPVPKWQEVKDMYYAPGLCRVMRSEITADEFLNHIEQVGNAVLNGE